MAARVFVWLGGALFVASLILCASSYALLMGRVMPWRGWAPLLGDALLVTVFALHHSLFARERIKDRLSRRIPPQLLRSAYVWIASLLLMLVSLMWQPVGAVFYTLTGPGAVACVAIQLAGLAITARGVSRIDPLELAGIHPPSRGEGLQVSGPYAWVRHPLYLGWALMVFGAAHMTGDRLAFATMTTFYLVVAIPFEERSLRRSFGDAYTRYVRDVRWRMVPFIY
jgi:protein-S-isoprenylcysteine O-methyltransferase Ste14